MTPDAERDHARLRSALARYESLVIAYSGGVDSGLLAYVASRALGAERAIAVIACSPSLAEREREAALEFLARHHIPYRAVETNELADERYRRNSPDRCYFCKHELFATLWNVARERGFSHVAYGANLDDEGDHRPGAIAARDHGAVAPLVDARLTKPMIRNMAAALGLSLWDKPASPCLASRVPYFQEVTRQKLAQIEMAEALLKDFGFAVCRVRHHGTRARIEIPLGDHDRIRAENVWTSVVKGLAAAGFDEVSLESDGFRSGRLNDAIGKP
jgi:uncharacterized protein